LLHILKDTSIYAVGDILTKGIGFLSIIFYANFLSQSDMGAYGYILVIIGFVSTFLILGMDNAYARYFFEYKNQDDKKVLTSTLFIFLSIWILTILVLPIYFSTDISYIIFEVNSYGVVLFFAFIGLPLKLMSSISNQVLRNQFKTKQYISFNFITAFISVLTAILLLNFTKIGISSIFIAIIIADILVLPFRIFAIKELLIKRIDFSMLKKLLLYGVPFLPVSLAYWIFSSSDRIMLESMSSLESVGMYTVALTLSAVMSIVASSIGQAWSPHAIKLYEEDQEKARILYEKFLVVLISIALFILFTASLIGKEVIGLIFPSEYQGTFYPMLFLLAAVGFQLTGQVTASGIGLKKKTIYLVYITIFVASINIMLNYTLIPIYSEIGAAIATMISYIVLTGTYGIVSQKLFAIRYDSKFLLVAFGILFSIFIVSFLDIYFRVFIFMVGVMYIYFQKNKIKEFIR